ncbi:Cerato-platanin [Gloeopeniophorella convolvens]|nr:Cerato-platanin [Gloeopeniophorella convolvens]
MKFTSAIIVLVAFVSTAAATHIRYNETYDNPHGSLNTVACSNGDWHGLTTQDFIDFQSLPSFPNIGAAQAIAGFNSPACGSCWQITYEGKSIIVTAIDHADDGFTLSLEAMNTLTDGNAVELGVVDATAEQVAASKCGL